MLDYVIMFFLASGFFFLFVGVVGLLRLPDLYTRMHAVGKCDTLGTGLILVGLILLICDLTNVVKLLMIVVLTATINPVMTHLIAKIAYNHGTELVQGSFVINDYAASPQGEEDVEADLEGGE